MSKILVLGKGYIGEKVASALGADISGKQFQSYTEAAKEIKRFNPWIIINCIGVTGRRNVDDCELQKDDVLTANSFLPFIFAEVALRNKLRLVHISSGCIFHYNYRKDTPITEEKAPDFFELFYSRSKIYAEWALKLLAVKYPILIARIRIPLDSKPHPKNLLTKLIKYKKVIDLPNSVTYLPDFLMALKHLIRIKAQGIYNVVNEGGLYYPDLMQVYKRYVPDFNYKIVPFRKLHLVRSNLILSCAKLKKSGFQVRPVKEILEECVREYVKY
ncbi:MAG: sugar nucleotide-binding protein [Candidatus Omnitrophica bacterium]|nr:sugar nucleotide-binding protein [Candidatus Omnitrophota bacterium]